MASSIGRTVGLGAASAGVLSLLEPELQWAQQTQWRQIPIQFPDVQSCLAAWQRGWLTGNQAAWALKSQGVDLPWLIGKKPASGDMTRTAIWANAAKLIYQRPDPEQIFQGHLRGIHSTADARKLMREAGANYDHYLTNALTYYSWLPPTELMVLRNRGVIRTDDEFYELLSRFGPYTEQSQKLFNELRKAYPPISDLVHFAVREVFQPELASQLGLFNERPVALEHYFQAAGLGWSTGQRIKPGDGPEREADWLDMVWGSHWQAISPTQAYTAFHRLRPSQIQRYQADFPGLKPFLLDDVRRALRVADYPPAVRDTLAAIAYTPMRLVDIRNAYLQDVEGATDQWVIDRYLDRGMSPDDAAMSAALLAKLYEKKDKPDPKAIQRECGRKWLAALNEGLRIGTVTIDQMDGELERQGIDPEVIANCHAAHRLALTNQLTKEVVRAIRKEYLHGGMTAGEVDLALIRTGIARDVAEAYRNAWTAQLTISKREVSAATVVRWYRKGLIPQAVALLRLTNLGFLQADRALLLAEAEQQIAQALLKEEQALGKRVEAEAKAVESAKRDAQRVADRMQARLRRLTPVGKLLSWLKRGTISEDYFRSRMDAMGFPPEIVQEYIEGIDYGTNGQVESAPAATEEEEPGT